MRTVGELLAPHLAASSRIDPQKPALIQEGRRVSYRELAARSERLAHWLHAGGVGKGDRVAALLYNCPEYFELYLGCALVGALLVPISFRLAAPEVAALLADAEPRALVYGPELRPLVEEVRAACPGVRHWLRLGGDDDQYEAALAAMPATPAPRAALEPTDDLMILYSSGTTGRPKGSVWSHLNALWFAAVQVAEYGIDREDVTLLTCPLYNGGGLAEWSIPTLLRGGTCVILPSRGFSAARLLETIRRERVTVTLFLPVMLYDLLRLPDLGAYDLSSLRLALAGGEPIPPAVTQQMLRTFPDLAYGEAYGLTEGTLHATYVRPRDMARKIGSVGQPTLGTEVRVVDEQGRDLPPGAEGEVIVRSPAVVSRYWRQPELSARTFRAGYCYTGDLGRLDEEGFLSITGRKKDLIISGAEKIAPAEVEAALHAHPAVLEAAVIGAPHPRWGETVVAVVALKPGAGATAEELIAWCGARLAGYKRPRRVELVERLPRSSMHKVLKDELRARFGQVHPHD